MPIIPVLSFSLKQNVRDSESNVLNIFVVDFALRTKHTKVTLHFIYIQLYITQSQIALLLQLQITCKKMRRHSIVLALLGILFLSTSVVKAGLLRSKQSANNEGVTENESVHSTDEMSAGDDQINEKEKMQNLRAGRKLERKKIRVHTVRLSS